MNRARTPFCLLFLIISCGGGGNPTDPASTAGAEYTAFGAPQSVILDGYSGDAMEPFISRDGRFLFFNDDANGKDLHVASLTDPSHGQYLGPLSNLNTPWVEGVPSLDDGSAFYFISTAHYAPPTNYACLYRGRWDGTNVSGVAPLADLAIPIPGYLNFDLDISPDGGTLLFVDGDFRRGGSLPGAADLAIALRQGTGFVRVSNAPAILAFVNTKDLEYAPAISRDLKELFFTRMHAPELSTRIMRSARATAEGVFSPPQKVSSIEGFVEGPAFSPDEKRLYFHKRNAAWKYELFFVGRP